MEKKTALNSSVRPEQKVEITGLDFLMSEQLVDVYLQTLSGYCLPKRYKYIDKNEEPFEGIPTKEQLESGEVRHVFDINNTFSKNNLVECYKLVSNYQEDAEQEYQNILNIMELKRNLFQTLDKEASAGRTTLISTLQKEFVDSQELNMQVNAE